MVIKVIDLRHFYSQVAYLSLLVFYFMTYLCNQCEKVYNFTGSKPVFNPKCEFSFGFGSEILKDCNPDNILGFLFLKVL